MKKLVLFVLASLSLQTAMAQGDGKSHYAPKSKKKAKVGTVYFGGGVDGYVLSTAMIKENTTESWGTPRFTGFFHIGSTAHFNFNSHVGLMSGVNIKNIGFIQKMNNATLGDYTYKARVYTIGIPLAIKIGDMTGNFFMLGGGIDMPFHFKEKVFKNRNDKEYKEGEWFSQRNATLLPYVFVGMSLRPGFVVKAQYYPTNFLNSDYTETVSGMTVKPYANKNVNLVMLTFGIQVPYKAMYK